MMTENLTKCRDSFAFYLREIGESHRDAINSGNEFAALAIFSVIEKSHNLRADLERLTDAAMQESRSNKERTKAT